MAGSGDRRTQEGGRDGRSVSASTKLKPPSFIQAGDFDCMLLAGRYTLLEQGRSTTLLPYCAEQNVSLLIGGPLQHRHPSDRGRPGGLLRFAPASAEIMERVSQDRGGVHDAITSSLASAALQFPLGHPNIATLIPRRPLAGRDRPEHKAIFEVDIRAALGPSSSVRACCARMRRRRAELRLVHQPSAPAANGVLDRAVTRVLSVQQDRN